MKVTIALIQTSLLSCALALAQQSASHVEVPASDSQRVIPATTGAERAPAAYILGPDDQLTVVTSNIEELSPSNLKVPLRIDLEGNVNLPLVGSIHAAGLTVVQLEAEIRERLTTFVRAPDVVVVISEFRSQPVSVLGAVTNPGVHQVEGHKTLLELLSMAGGLRQDAGSTVKITRNLIWGRIPLPKAQDDPTGEFSIASLDIRPIMAASDPAGNIVIKPNDVISVPVADIVYAIGCVKRPGGFPLGENRSLSALQVLALAEGLDKFAVPQRAKIIRTIPGTATRTQVAVDLRSLITGKGSDVFLEPNDILFVPTSTAKAAAAETADTLVRIAAGVAVYGRY